MPCRVACALRLNRMGRLRGLDPCTAHRLCVPRYAAWREQPGPRPRYSSRRTSAGALPVWTRTVDPPAPAPVLCRLVAGSYGPSEALLLNSAVSWVDCVADVKKEPPVHLVREAAQGGLGACAFGGVAGRRYTPSEPSLSWSSLAFRSAVASASAAAASSAWSSIASVLARVSRDAARWRSKRPGFGCAASR